MCRLNHSIWCWLSYVRKNRGHFLMDLLHYITVHVCVYLNQIVQIFNESVDSRQRPQE